MGGAIHKCIGTLLVRFGLISVMLLVLEIKLQKNDVSSPNFSTPHTGKIKTSLGRGHMDSRGGGGSL
jgi:hypothetical protein